MSTTIERYVIRHISGTKANQVEEFDFSKAELSIGRTTGSDIQFDPDQEVIVSREHGKIVKLSDDPPKFEIRDNNSRNGIFVNKNRVKGNVALEVGDEVQLGLNGPVFSFDINPRPQDMMAATRMVEIPTSIKSTTISEVAVVPDAEPVKTGLGKQTVERMLVAERKKSSSKMLLVVGGIVVLLGALGYAFKDKIFKGNTTIVTVQDSSTKDKKSPEQISKENEDRVVQIEFGWQIFDANTSDELWHVYVPVKGANGLTNYLAAYIENYNGGIEPYLDIKRNVQMGVQIGIAGSSGSGFVVSEDGFILTNRHVGASWNTRYNFPQYAFPGVLIRSENGKPQIVEGVSIMPQQVGGYVPANATMVGGRQVNQGAVKGRNTYMNVVFANTVLRRPAVSVTPSDEHDVAMLKIDIPESLTKVTMKDSYDDIKAGQVVTVMGYPGVAPEEYVVRKSNDPFNPQPQYTTMPTPTLTTGNIGRVIPASSDKNLTYSGFGDSYQLTINATGSGNSGGPMFDDKGNVVGIYYAGASLGGANISFAVPIKYGLELMGRKKMSK